MGLLDLLLGRRHAAPSLPTAPSEQPHREAPAQGDEAGAAQAHEGASDATDVEDAVPEDWDGGSAWDDSGDWDEDSDLGSSDLDDTVA